MNGQVLSIEPQCARLQAHRMSLEEEIIVSMNERVFLIDQMLADHKFVTIDQLMTRLEISLATLKRDLAFMRDRMNFPIVFDRDLGGYRFDHDMKIAGVEYRRSGLWFSSEEIYALLTMHYLISNLDDTGLLGTHVKALQARLTGLMGAANDSVEEVQRRIKIEMIRVRHVQLNHFEAIGSALLKRKRLSINHYSRGKDLKTEREVSPQRMIFYHGNWYLDAWCHLRNELRSFSVDTIERAVILETKAKEVSQKALDDVLTAGYGIFAGKKVQWATMVFAPKISRWVSSERWHKDQKGKTLNDGSYELKVPYSDDTELLMDIMRYGANVKVLSPASLVKGVTNEVVRMQELYQS